MAPPLAALPAAQPVLAVPGIGLNISSSSARPAHVELQRRPTAAATHRRRLLSPLCAAATGEGRGKAVLPGTSTTGSSSSNSSNWAGAGSRAASLPPLPPLGNGTSSSSSSSGSSSSSSYSEQDPLLCRIAAASTARELHLLMLRHTADLGGQEVALALQTAAQRKLLRPSDGSSNGASGGYASGASASSAALCALLVQLAMQHAAAMEPPALSAAAWSLAALQLAPARPVLRTMHALAAQRLVQFSPSQLCMVLWAGGDLDPGYRSPLFRELNAVVQRGMSLAMFSPHDLAILAWICGREGGAVATDLLQAVVAECRTRVQEYGIAQQRHQRAWAEAAPAEAAAQAAHQGPRLGRPVKTTTAAGERQQQQSAAERQQQSEQQPGQPGQQRPPPPPLQPPPFGPAEAAMLLTGLASKQMRVEGLVEPLLLQCEPAFGTAAANDLARICVALGNLQMEMGLDLFSNLLSSLSARQAELSPQQVAGALWSSLQFGSQLRGLKQLPNMAMQHYAARHAEYGVVDTICLLWALPHFHKALPDEYLLGALGALRPGLQQCSTSVLSNLVGALGRAAAIRCGHVDLHADKTKTGRGRPQQRARGASSAWLDSPAGSELLAATSAAVTQLARHTPSMTTAELAAATTALATHAPHAAALPAPAVAVLQRACAAVLSAGELSLLDLAAVATAAARLQWSYPGLVDNLAAAAHARAPVLTSLRGVLPQLVAALAALAPTRHPRVWASLAGVYAAKLARAESFYPSAASAANLPVFDAEERQTVLAAFAAVARVQTLPHQTLLDVLGTAKPADVTRATPATQAAVLALAGGAQLEPDAPLVLACCTGIKRNLARMSLEELRLSEAGLRRLPGGDAELLDAVWARIAHLDSIQSADLL